MWFVRWRRVERAASAPAGVRLGVPRQEVAPAGWGRPAFVAAALLLLLLASLLLPPAVAVSVAAGLLAVLVARAWAPAREVERSVRACHTCNESPEDVLEQAVDDESRASWDASLLSSRLVAQLSARMRRIAARRVISLWISTLAFLDSNML